MLDADRGHYREPKHTHTAQSEKIALSAHGVSSRSSADQRRWPQREIGRWDKSSALPLKFLVSSSGTHAGRMAS